MVYSCMWISTNIVAVVVRIKVTYAITIYIHTSYICMYIIQVHSDHNLNIVWHKKFAWNLILWFL